MKIVLLNGNQDARNDRFENYVSGLARNLERGGSEVSEHTLRDKTIHFCTGCWSCWWKTPGVCAFSDDMIPLYREIVAADWLVFATPLRMGFVSSLLKKTNDRMIPLLLPFIALVEGECHHELRYGRMPKLAVLVEKTNTTDDRDMDIIMGIYERFALNMRSSLGLRASMDKDYTEVADEINAH